MSQFLQPHTMQELADALGQMTEKSRIIAGGTDLIIELRNRRPEVDTMINIWGLPELTGVREEDGWVRVGAATTHDAISKDPIIKEKFTALAMACSKVGSQQVRNKGTIGGSLVNASPAGDMIPCVCLFKGEIEVLKADGTTYRIPAADFTLGVKKTAMQPQEALVAIWMPVRENRHSAFVKLGSRKEVTIAQINMAISWEKDEHYHDIEGYLGAVDTKPLYLEELESILANKEITKEQREELTQSLRNRITVIRENRKRPPKLKITEAEQLYKERSVRSVVYDIIDLMEEN